MFYDPGITGNPSLQHSPESWKYDPNPKPHPNPYSSLFLINIYPCSAPDRPEAPKLGPPLYFCAQARYLRALGLRRGLRCPEGVSMVPRRCLNGDPGVPKCAPRLPKVFQRDHKGPQKRDKLSAMRSPEHALALQCAFKGVLDTSKLRINCTSGHYVSNICCSIISTVTSRIIIELFPSC